MNNSVLRVMWFVPPAVAVAASWSEYPGFTLEASRTQSSDEQFDALVSGSVDAVVTSMDNILHWNQRNGPKDFVIVAQVEATTPLSVIGAHGFKELRDLKGSNILVDAPDNGFVIALRAMLDSVGLEADDYSLIPVGGVSERFVALAEGQGDATLLGPPFDSFAVHKGLCSVASVQALYPEFPGQGLIVRRSAVENNAALKVWIGQLLAALKTLSNNMEKLKAELADQGMPEEAVSAIVSSLPNRLTPDPRGICLLVEHRKQLGLLGSDATYEGIVDLSLLN